MTSDLINKEVEKIMQFIDETKHEGKTKKAAWYFDLDAADFQNAVAKQLEEQHGFTCEIIGKPNMTGFKCIVVEWE